MAKLKIHFRMPALRIGRESQLTLLFTVLMFAFFKPAHYIIGATFNRLWKLYTIAVCLFSLGWFFYARRGRFQKRDLAVLFLLTGYVFSYLIATLTNWDNANFFDATQNTMETIGYVCLAATGLIFYTRTFLKGYLNAGLFWTTLHLCTILMFQNGGMRKGRNLTLRANFSENWFLMTHANASYFIILPVAAVFFFYAYTYNPKLKKPAWLYLAFSIICFLTQWSVAGLIGFVVFTAFMLTEVMGQRIRLNNRSVKNRKPRFRFYLIALIILNILLTFGGLLNASIDLAYKYFHKMHSLKARVTIWTRCMDALSHDFRWLFGFGWEDEAVTARIYTFNHMHNFMLEVLFRGGVIALVLFTAALMIAFFQRRLNGLERLQCFRILVFVTIAFLLSSMFDFYMYRYEILVVFLMFLYFDRVQISLTKYKVLKEGLQ